MHFSTFSPAAGLAFSFCLSSTTAAVISTRNVNDRLVLANCHGSNGLSSEMAYYSGSIGGPPDTITTVSVGNGNVNWEGQQISGTFPDGNVFRSNIVSPKVPNGAYAGTGSNSEGGFYCYHQWLPNVYTDANGNGCDSLYICNHNVPTSPAPPPPPPSPPTPQAEVRFDFTVNGNYVTMPGHWNAIDMLSTIDQAIGDVYCDSTKSYQIGDGSCRIAYSCHGDVSYSTTHGMASALKNVVSKTPGLVNYYTQREKECTDTNPEVKPGQDPCIYTYVNKEYTQINNAVMMNVVYIPAGNPNGATDQGMLNYAINCPSTQNCGLCKGFSLGLQGAGLVAGDVPELAAAFEGANFVADAVCALEGC